MQLRKKHLRIAGLLLFVAVLVTISIVLDPTELLDPERLQERADESPWRASGLYFAAALGIKLLFVPFTPISLVAGLVFGASIGAALAMSVLLVGSLLTFGLARWLGRDWVRGFTNVEEGKARIVERLLENHGLLAVVVLRLVPTVPISAVNMLLGVSAVGWSDFALGTVLGLLPGTILLALVGSKSLEPKSPEFWLYASAFGLVVLAGVLTGEWMRRRERRKRHGQDSASSKHAGRARSAE